MLPQKKNIVVYIERERVEEIPILISRKIINFQFLSWNIAVTYDLYYGSLNFFSSLFFLPFQFWSYRVYHFETF